MRVQIYDAWDFADDPLDHTLTINNILLVDKFYIRMLITLFHRKIGLLAQNRRYF